MKQLLWTKLSAYKMAWASFAFTLALIAFEEWYFENKSHIFPMFIISQFENATEVIIRVSIQLLLVFMVTAWFVWAALASKLKYKAIYFVFFTSVIFLEYGYKYGLNNYMAIQDIYTAMTSVNNWDEAIVTYVNWASLGPVFLFGLLLMRFKSVDTYGLKLFLLSLVSIVSLNVATVYYANLDSREQILKVFTTGPSISVASFFRVVTHLGLEQLSLTQISRQTITFQAKTQPSNNVVFIIDESVRTDHLSVNGYERPTTPFLQQLVEHQQLYSWGESASGSTCTMQSGAMLLTGVNYLPDETFALRQWPSILQYAKAMNYTTHYLDGGGNKLRFPLTSDDLAYVDHTLFLEDLGLDPNTDMRLADQAAAILNESTGNFIVLLKRGSHFPYGETFPADQAIWTPILGPKEILSDNPAYLINTYDNSILHNVNRFFKRLLTNPKLLDTTVIVYTSDHGQNLGEIPSKHPHCGQTRFAAMVPILLITNQKMTVDTGFKAAHSNIFATLLDLMNIPQSEHLYDYPVSLLQATAADSVPRHYFYGSIFGLGENGWLDFD